MRKIYVLLIFCLLILSIFTNCKETEFVTITFDSGLLSMGVEAIETVKDKSVILPSGDSLWETDSYLFSGWAVSENGNVKYKAGDKYSVAAEVTLYAVWKKNWDIKYYNGTTLIGVGYPTTNSVTIGDGNGLSKDGHALYWTTSSNGTGISYDIGEVYTGFDSLVLYAQWQEDDGSLTYTLDTTSKTYSVKASSTSISGEIEIPEIYKGKKVTAVDELGFEECINITGMKIPSSVTSIGGGAFYCCTSLVSVNIPDGITELKPYEERDVYDKKGLFEHCLALEKIEIPKSVTKIGDKAFVFCVKLPSSFKIPDTVTSIGQNAFYFSGIRGEITLPESLESVGDKAFLYCYDLTKVTIPSSVTAIGSYAFSGSSNLTISISNINLESGSWNSILADYDGSGTYSVIIENGEAEIGKQFQNCANVTSISIPSSVTSIDSSAFSGCSKLTSIYVDKDTDALTGSPWGAPSTDCTVTWK